MEALKEDDVVQSDERLKITRLLVGKKYGIGPGVCCMAF
jgi:hypothetical protein